MEREDWKNDWWYWLIKLGIIASLGLLLVTVFKYGVIRHKYYFSLARDNKIFESRIPSARGKIIDRKGRVIARSVYQYFSTENETTRFEGDGEFQGLKFEGKDLAFDLRRQYPYQEALSFVSGYVGKVNEVELKKDVCDQGMNLESVVGRSGIEETFDCKLRGEDGKRLVEVDALGNYVRELGRQEPVGGSDIQVSIDAFWQERLYKLMAGRKGAAVVSEPKSGRILALVSSMGFDPNVFSYKQDNQKITEYLEDKENLPLLNRAVAARFHPGSVFKITVATGGLETGKIDKGTLIEDTGVLRVGDYSYNNWLWTKRGQTDGMVDIVKALQRSNDIFFYKLGEILGVDDIKKWAEIFGYGRKTGIEISGELSGIVPDDKWKMETKGERWYLGNTYHLAIGQGDLSVTPLQVNQMTNVIANRGIKCSMTLLQNQKKACQDLEIKKETVETVIEGMRRACMAGGTAWPLFNFKTEIACKTGTAEVGDGSKDVHAWLTAFAPINDPQISITVLLERGGEGSDVAAPVVGDFLKEWFDEKETKVPRYGADGKITFN